jgi:hypothetical protein
LVVKGVVDASTVTSAVVAAICQSNFQSPVFWTDEGLLCNGPYC